MYFGSDIETGHRIFHLILNNLKSYMAKGQIGGTKKNINLKKEAERISPSLLSLQ